jgi:uncharacterized protein DUF6428
MKTREFLDLLNENQEKELVFEYAKGQFVPKAYHITEVKNLHFDSVDCGGNEHTESQTIVQLWTSPIEVKNRYMESGKALKIMEKVDSMKPINRDTDIFFEYGNREQPTSNYSIKKAELDESKIVLKMYVQPTACKPAEFKNLKNLATACCGGTSKCC